MLLIAQKFVDFDTTLIVEEILTDQIVVSPCYRPWRKIVPITMEQIPGSVPQTVEKIIWDVPMFVHAGILHSRSCRRHHFLGLFLFNLDSAHVV